MLRRTVIAAAITLIAAMSASTAPPAAVLAPAASGPARSAAAICVTRVQVGRILTVGDSITAPGLWQQQLATRLDDACATYEIYNSGIGGYSTKDANPALSQLLTAVKPALVIYGMAINDDLTGFRDRYWTSMSLIRQWAPGVKIIPMFAQHMGPTAPTWISARQKNDDIYADTFYAGGFAPNVVGYMSNNQIPPNATYQQPDGIHLTDAGQVKAGDQAYRGLTQWGAYPLPLLPADPDLCPTACP